MPLAEVAVEWNALGSRVHTKGQHQSRWQRRQAVELKGQLTHGGVEEGSAGPGGGWQRHAAGSVELQGATGVGWQRQ